MRFRVWEVEFGASEGKRRQATLNVRAALQLKWAVNKL